MSSNIQIKTGKSVLTIKDLDPTKLLRHSKDKTVPSEAKEKNSLRATNNEEVKDVATSKEPNDTMLLFELKNGYLFNPEGLWKRGALDKTEFIANWDKVKSIETNEKEIRITLTEKDPKHGEIISISVQGIDETTLKFLTAYSLELKSPAKVDWELIHKINNSVLHVDLPKAITKEEEPSSGDSNPEQRDHWEEIRQHAEEVRDKRSKRRRGRGYYNSVLDN